MPKRKDEIEGHLAALEVPAINERMADWERALVCKYRIQFDRTGDLNDREFEALEKMRHRVAPPKLSKSGVDASAYGKITPAPSCLYVEVPRYGIRVPVEERDGLFFGTLRRPKGHYTWCGDSYADLQDRFVSGVLSIWRSLDAYNADSAQGSKIFESSRQSSKLFPKLQADLH